MARWRGVERPPVVQFRVLSRLRLSVMRLSPWICVSFFRFASGRLPGRSVRELSGEILQGFASEEQGDCGDHARCGDGPLANRIDGILRHVRAFFLGALPGIRREGAGADAAPAGAAPCPSAGRGCARSRSSRRATSGGSRVTGPRLRRFDAIPGEAACNGRKQQEGRDSAGQRPDQGGEGHRNADRQSGDRREREQEGDPEQDCRELERIRLRRRRSP